MCARVTIIVYLHVFVCVHAHTHMHLCGKVLKQFTTAGFPMNEGIRIADVEYGAKK